MSTRRLTVLGSSGSVGRQTLDVVRAHTDSLEVVGLSANSDAATLREQIAEFQPEFAALESGDSSILQGTGAQLITGPGAASELASVSADVVMNGVVGFAGLAATVAALKAGNTVALANKESLVTGGEWVMDLAPRSRIIPVDSEHSAIFQCLEGRGEGEVEALLLTASGGPFFTRSREELACVGQEAALAHPTWQMGPKITIDSATMMNKGLEVIEARWLFGLRADQIDVLVHPQSVIHSMVELLDGSVIAQLGATDMRLPIQYAFSYPQRWTAPLPPLDLVTAGPLEFIRPDTAAFPCLGLAYRALDSAPSLSVVLNAANEVAVALFLEGRLSFPGIAHVIESAMHSHAPVPIETLGAVRDVDRQAREQAQTIARGLESEV